MPANGILVRRDQYPEVAWSSWFGGYTGTEYPSARPYAVIIKAPGSTGIFTPVNIGIKCLVTTISFTTGSRYDSTFMPPTSSVAMLLNLTLAPGGLTRFNILYYQETGVPVFFYAQITDAFWANTRKAIFIPGPGPPPFPLISRIGPIVQITPFNKKGWMTVE